MIWQTTRFQIDLTAPKVMGIVNVTPDSFSDGGQFFTATENVSKAIAHCEQLIKDGAHILDIGGESSRPGAQPVSLEEELGRVIPVVRHALTLGVPVSVDTYKPQVMQAALDLGADIINDIWALRQPGTQTVIAQHANCGVCLMHMHREPQTMQTDPMQGDAVVEVLHFLEQRSHDLQALGIHMNRMVLDPGIGFGKTPQQNFALLARQRELLTAGYPLMVGWSRKSSLAPFSSPSLGDASSSEQPSRMMPSVVTAVVAVERGARIVRVHDVLETALAIALWTKSRSP